MHLGTGVLLQMTRQNAGDGWMEELRVLEWMTPSGIFHVLPCSVVVAYTEPMAPVEELFPSEAFISIYKGCWRRVSREGGCMGEVNRVFSYFMIA